MPEWVYWLGWLAVPVAGVALLALRHERGTNQALSDLLAEVQDSYYDTLVINRQLRSELHRVDGERAELHHARVSHG